MKKVYKHEGLIWVDLETPSKEEVREIMEEFSIHPIVAEELLIPTLRPKVDLYDNLIYLILHFPAEQHTSEDTNQEVDFIIGKNFLITVRYETIDAVHKFSKIFESNQVTKNSDLGDHAGYLFYFLIKKMYGSVEHELEFVESQLLDIEDQIFEGHEKEMVQELSRISRILLDFKQATRAHETVLNSLDIAGNKFFGSMFAHHLKRIVAEQYRIKTQIDVLQETMRELQSTNDSLLTTKQNEVMKILTIMAFVTFPLSLIASIFGMNTEYMPFIGNQYDFWIVIGIMFVLTSIFFFFFKKNKWL